jgi:hypothetical protein
MTLQFHQFDLRRLQVGLFVILIAMFGFLLAGGHSLTSSLREIGPPGFWPSNLISQIDLRIIALRRRCCVKSPPVRRNHGFA